MRENNNWIKNAVIYQILIDRFAGYNEKKDWMKPQFIGGNIKGIIDKLPYLKNLGINLIWLSPFYKTSEYHGYHITDFFDVDHHYGTKEDLKRLIKLIHDNNMYIIADFVPNHLSRSHPFFKDAVSSKTSTYRDWFYFTKWPDEYLSFLSIKEIPKINLAHEQARNHIIEAAKYWLSFGLDGFRLDHVIGPTNQFWKIFSKEIKSSFPQVILIGEAWMQGISWHELKTIQIPWKKLKWLQKRPADNVLTNYQNILDGVLDFTAQQLFHQFFCLKNKPINDLKKSLNKHYTRFQNKYLLPVFLDNHDMDRFLFRCNNNIEKLKQAARIQSTIKQPMIIYYGTEQGLSQKNSMWHMKEHGDLLARKPMPWDKTNDENELYYFYRNLIQKRMSIK